MYDYHTIIYMPKNTLNILTWNEFQKEHKMKYFALVSYLNKKYDNVNYDYGKKTEADRGLFIHHVMEWRFADLSSECGREEFPEYQKANHLVFCNWLEHLLLHAKIFTEWDSPRKGQEDNGALNFILPQLYAYLEMGLKAAKYNDTYYNNISNEDALKIFKVIVLMFIPEYSNRYIIDNIIKMAEYNLELDGKQCNAYIDIVSKRTIWSQSELDALKETYPISGPLGVKEKLIKINGADIRTEAAIIARAQLLKVHSYSKKIQWSEEEDTILKNNYLLYPVEYIQKYLLSTKSINAITGRIYEIKNNINVT